MPVESKRVAELARLAKQVYGDTAKVFTLCSATGYSARVDTSEHEVFFVASSTEQGALDALEAALLVQLFPDKAEWALRSDD